MIFGAAQAGRNAKAEYTTRNRNAPFAGGIHHIKPERHFFCCLHP